MTTPAVDVQLAEIRGALGQINLKLTNEAEWRTRELTGMRASIDEIKSTVFQVRQHSDDTASTVRVDLERQLAQHTEAVNPHSAQEEWLRNRLDSLSAAVAAIGTQMAQQTGARKAVFGLIGFVVGAAVPFVANLAR